jgi:hypothetical protein
MFDTFYPQTIIYLILGNIELVIVTKYYLSTPTPLNDLKECNEHP